MKSKDSFDRSRRLAWGLLLCLGILPAAYCHAQACLFIELLEGFLYYNCIRDSLAKDEFGNPKESTTSDCHPPC